jgi:hypothetical protein
MPAVAGATGRRQPRQQARSPAGSGLTGPVDGVRTPRRIQTHPTEHPSLARDAGCPPRAGRPAPPRVVHAGHASARRPFRESPGSRAFGRAGTALAPRGRMRIRRNARGVNGLTENPCAGSARNLPYPPRSIGRSSSGIPTIAAGNPSQLRHPVTRANGRLRRGRPSTPAGDQPCGSESSFRCSRPWPPRRLPSGPRPPRRPPAGDRTTAAPPAGSSARRGSAARSPRSTACSPTPPGRRPSP